MMDFILQFYFISLKYFYFNEKVINVNEDSIAWFQLLKVR